MRLSLRFIVPLLLVLAAFAYAVLPLVDDLTVRWFVRDLDIRATLIANTVREPIEDLIRSGDQPRVLQLLRRITEDERVYAAAVCPSPEAPPVLAGTLPPAVRCADLELFSGSSGHILTSPQGPLLVSVRPLGAQGVHDGMNLVAKEFVAARDDERGVLVLSQFTGATRELPEAIIVNPYDTDECAAALQAALEMPDREQRARMRLMRGLIRECNVFRWAGRMLIDVASMRNRRRLLDRLAAQDSRRGAAQATAHDR